MGVVRDAIHGITDFGAIMESQREAMQLLVSVASQLLDDVRARADEKEMTEGERDAINNCKHEDRNAYESDLAGDSGGPERFEPCRRGPSAEDTIDEPLDRPWLKQLNERGENKKSAAKEDLLFGSRPIGEESPQEHQ